MKTRRAKAVLVFLWALVRGIFGIFILILFLFLCKHRFFFLKPIFPRFLFEKSVDPSNGIKIPLTPHCFLFSEQSNDICILFRIYSYWSFLLEKTGMGWGGGVGIPFLFHFLLKQNYLRGDMTVAPSWVRCTCIVSVVCDA